MHPFFVSLSQKMPAFVEEPDSTPPAPGFEHRATSRPSLLPVAMDTGVDGGVGVSGDGGGYLPKASRLEKVSELPWE